MSFACKLCASPTRFRYTKTILGSYRADYVECTSCGSLQVTESPWLAEAYATESWALDTGLVARNLILAGQISAFLSAAGIQQQLVLDYGGGTGLLTRLLRDAGWSVLCHEPYRTPLFVEAYHVATLDGLAPSVLIASEVFEHFIDPRNSLATILRTAPIIVFTTELYAGQDTDWWYLAPDLGQHVFFYSRSAIETVARGNGCSFIDTGLLKYFIHQDRVAQPDERQRVEAAIRAGADPAEGIAQIAAYLRQPFRYVAPDYARELEVHRLHMQSRVAKRTE